MREYGNNTAQGQSRADYEEDMAKFLQLQRSRSCRRCFQFLHSPSSQRVRQRPGEQFHRSDWDGWWSASDSKSAKNCVRRELTSLYHCLMIAIAQSSDCHASDGRCNQCTYHSLIHTDHFLAFASRRPPWPNVICCIKCHVLRPHKNQIHVSDPHSLLSPHAFSHNASHFRRVITLNRTGYILDRVAARSCRVRSQFKVQGSSASC